MRKRHHAFAAFAVLLFALGIAACDDSPEEGRTTVVVLSVNNGSPIESDVSTDSLVFEDFVPITMTSRPYNEFIGISEGSPHGDVIVEKYRITWTRIDGGSGTLPTREENMHVTIPLYDIVMASIRLVTWSDKSGPVLGPLVGTNNEVGMRADIEFTAREIGTEHEVKFAVSVDVYFADTV